jgi:hypothetical protein
MPFVHVAITRYVDDAQPGWVECQLVDVHGQTHVIVEKVPVVTESDFRVDSVYPTRGGVRCTVVARRFGDGCEICTIDTAHPDGVESTRGETRFDVSADCVADADELISK